MDDPSSYVEYEKKRDGVSAVGGVMCNQVNMRVENRSIGQGEGGGLRYKPGKGGALCSTVQGNGE